MATDGSLISNVDLLCFLDHISFFLLTQRWYVEGSPNSLLLKLKLERKHTWRKVLLGVNFRICKCCMPFYIEFAIYLKAICLFRLTTCHILMETLPITRKTINLFLWILVNVTDFSLASYAHLPFHKSPSEMKWIP